MNQLTNSRFITYPSTVDDHQYTIVVIDATPTDLAQIVLFCRTSNKNYDIYLYEGDDDDLQWLHHTTSHASKVLINEKSSVTITGYPADTFDASASNSVLTHFLQYDSEN